MTSTRAILVLLVFGLASCGPLADISQSATDCTSWQTYDEALGACVASQTLTECRGEDACGVGDRCSPAGVCTSDEYVVYVLSREQDVRVRRASVNVLYSMVEQTARQFDGFDILARPVRVERLAFDGTSEQSLRESLEPIQRSNTLAVMTSSPRDAHEIQGVLRGTRILQMAQYTSTSEFSDNERSWERFNFGLVPLPVSDITTWSSFLGDRTQPSVSSLARGRDFVTNAASRRCSRLGLVYAPDQREEVINRVISSLIGSDPRVELVESYIVDSSVVLERDSIYARMHAADVDCVFAHSLPRSDISNGIVDIVSGYPTWRRAEGVDAPFRWLFLLSNSFATYYDALDALGVADELVGAVGANYDTSGVVPEPLREAYLTSYSSAARNDCDTFGVSECDDWYSMDELATRMQRFPMSEDMATLVFLSTYIAERRGDVSRESLREAFLSLTSTSSRHSVCYRSALSQCLREIDRGNLVHYVGTSSDLVLGADGRMETINEIMIFSEVGADGGLVELARYTHDEMLETYEQLGSGEF